VLRPAAPIGGLPAAPIGEGPPLFLCGAAVNGVKPPTEFDARAVPTRLPKGRKSPNTVCSSPMIGPAGAAGGTAASCGG
jgi:hypothetical protein